MKVTRVYPAIRPGVRIHVGLPGAGKTHTMLFELEAFTIGGVPVIVFDRNREIKAWPGPSEILDSKKFRDLRALKAGILYIVYDELNETLMNYRHAIRLAKHYRDELVKKRPEITLAAGIAVPEAHLLLPKAGGNLEIVSATTLWRHRKLALWFDTQRLALLNTTAVEVARGPNAGGLRLFPMGGHNDLKLVKAMGGKPLMEMMYAVNKGYSKGVKGVYIDCALTEQEWKLAKMHRLEMYHEPKK